ncbi:MAG: MoaD/ThiS family protein [Deltaproteobacteria bacterium]|nr:MoaD/ThiS family protein [Deltaproteobacteria bacterium]NND29875.1 MoaD/ThiS family protein [Myxococcales bacterium]MBT8463062.1 MoaD/ThiS family protein [Deltaproteobacteria bacterium]MBT8483675.1 MoaD/ThiS family protein [Deltaproteobacteria bacterium]NNK08594.1 MoaD/ThiS family protein [Myxococcales bacterium]
MAVTVRIPTPLRSLTGGADEVLMKGGTVSEVIESLEASHPGMKDRLCDEKGVRRFVNIYANDEDIRFLDNLETALKDGDTLSIVPAIAGGSSA